LATIGVKKEIKDIGHATIEIKKEIGIDFGAI
jgi:hypothetical protein